MAILGGKKSKKCVRKLIYHYVISIIQFIFFTQHSCIDVINLTINDFIYALQKEVTEGLLTTTPTTTSPDPGSVEDDYYDSDDDDDGGGGFWGWGGGESQTEDNDKDDVEVDEGLNILRLHQTNKLMKYKVYFNSRSKGRRYYFKFVFPN